MKLTRLCLAIVILATVVPASEAVSAPGVSPWNRNCIRFYNKWKKNPKHRAFAVANWNSGESCGGTWGAPSKKAAEQGAMKWCKKFTESGAHCRVTASE